MFLLCKPQLTKLEGGGIYWSQEMDKSIKQSSLLVKCCVSNSISIKTCYRWSPCSVDVHNIIGLRLGQSVLELCPFFQIIWMKLATADSCLWREIVYGINFMRLNQRVLEFCPFLWNSYTCIYSVNVKGLAGVVSH